MYLPTIWEFLWSFSRFIDVVLEVPQLKRVFVSEEVDKWIIAYYCCIGSRVLLCAVNLVYRLVKSQDVIPGRRTYSRWFWYLTIEFIKADMSSIPSHPARRSPKGLSSLRSSLPASSINVDDGQPRSMKKTILRFICVVPHPHLTFAWVPSQIRTAMVRRCLNRKFSITPVAWAI